MRTRAELRALAEKARQWTVDEPMETAYGDFGYYVPGGPPIELDDSPEGQADALYLAALDPKTVLALLDELDRLTVPHEADTPTPEGPPPECPIGKHRFYVHELNTPCYGYDGEINLPPGTVHCRFCFKVKGARRRLDPPPSTPPRTP